MNARASEVGQRGRRFTLDVPLDTPDGFGGSIRTYQAGPQLWGSIELLSTAERLRADRDEAVATHRVTMRFRTDVTPDGRLSLGTRRFRVRDAADPDGRRRWLECLVEEIAP